MASMPLRTSALALVVAALALSPAAQAQTVKIQVKSLNTIQVVHDTAPKQKVNKGDAIFFKDLLLNMVAQFGKQKGKPVAYDVGTVTYTTSVTRKMSCVVTFPGIGTISYGGIVIDHADGTTTFPITGGTGGFKNAKGTVTLRAGKTTQPNIFDVTVPGHPLNLNGGGVA